MNQITIYSTCQGNGIKHYIKDYFSNYKINVIFNYQLVRDKNMNDLNNFRSLLKNTDIFIYQEMPKKDTIDYIDFSFLDEGFPECNSDDYESMYESHKVLYEKLCDSFNKKGTS